MVLSALNVWSHTAARWAGIEIPLALTAHHVFTLAADKPYTQDLPLLKDLAAPAKLYMRPMGGHLMVGSGTEGSARGPAWRAGCRVLTRPSRHSGTR